MDTVAQGSVQSTRDVVVVVPGAQDLSGEALAYFTSSTQKYAEKLLDEASKIEEGHRDQSSTVAQYTTGHIAQAETFLRTRGYGIARKRSKWVGPLRILQYVLTAIVGVTSNLMLASSPWLLTQSAWSTVFAVSLAVGIIVVIITEVIERAESAR